jgi:hypothetical protein
VSIFAYLQPVSTWVPFIRGPDVASSGNSMGRFQPSARAAFGDTLQKLRKEYQEALVNAKRREAFDRLVEVWSSEMGAISYAESLTLMDLLLLSSAVDNRASIESLRKRIDALDPKLTQTEMNHENSGSKSS